MKLYSLGIKLLFIFNSLFGARRQTTNLDLNCLYRKEHFWNWKKIERRSYTVWPDIGIKSSRNISKSCPKSCHSRYYLKLKFFKMAQKVTKYFAYICTKICSQEILKITQSGHSGHNTLSCLSRTYLNSKRFK